ncbi:hypothetical protein Tco_0313535 [Tanacetum coccineum]
MSRNSDDSTDDAITMNFVEEAFVSKQMVKLNHIISEDGIQGSFSTVLLARSGFTPVDLAQHVRVGLTQLAVWVVEYIRTKCTFLEASTLGVSEVEGPLLVVPVTWSFSLVFSAVKALSFSVYALPVQELSVFPIARDLNLRKGIRIGAQ